MTTPRDRIDALLVDEATGNLEDAGRTELDALLGEHPSVDRYAFERAAATVFLAIGGVGGGRMPAALRSKLADDAERLLSPGD